MRRTAFTLIELLVVVAIIIALLAILLPSMGRALEISEMTVCQTQHRQIALAWASYYSDNLGQIVESRHWVGQDAGYTESEDAIRRGKLWPYLRDLDIYLCPSDPRGILRSYSMSIYLNGYNTWHLEDFVTTVSQINNPASILLVLDEADPRGVNHGPWVINPYYHATHSEQWVDWPAPWHMAGNTMSFADGHTEWYQFRDEMTARIGGFYWPAPNSEDLDYYQSIYTP